tara:strand:- start:16 stop:294 length:279 start_codon:yes stop_codon:yes gene_type:complete
VWLDDIIRFKDVVKTIDLAKYSHSHREYCEEVERLFKQIVLSDVDEIEFMQKSYANSVAKEIIYDEYGDTKKEKINEYGDVIKEEKNNDREV